jgi:hypothetical protein
MGGLKRKYGDEKGYVLMAATVFAFVLLLGGVTVFSIAYGESRNARYKQDAWEAFYLADSAMERARAHILTDASWRDGFTDVDLGNGSYTLSLKDTTHATLGDVVKLTSTGTVGGATRSIEIFCEIIPAAFSHTMVVSDDLETTGNVCIEGLVYVGDESSSGNGGGNGNGGGGNGNGNGNGNGGGGCEVTYTEFDVNPPAMYMDDDHFPGATYYDVRAVRSGSNWKANIFDGDGVDITSAVGDSLVGIVSGNNSEVDFEFDTDAKIDKYFDDITGVFKRKAGDSSVVVNFGNGANSTPPGSDALANIIIDANSYPTIHATIVNTRFTGVTEADRLESEHWEGGELELHKVIFEPYNGIAFATHNFIKGQGHKVYIGTDDYPALLLVTKEADNIHPNFNSIGTIICLDEWDIQGNTTIQYNPGYIENLPSYLTDASSTVASSVLVIQTWKEL